MKRRSFLWSLPRRAFGSPRTALLSALAVVLPALAIPAVAQETTNRAASLAVKYDLDTPAAVSIVASVDLTNTTLTIANQPSPAALIAFTVVDTTPSITDGDITVTGVDAHGTTRVEVLDASAGAGTYTTSYRYASLTSIVTSSFVTLGGSSDETISATTTLSAVYCRLSGVQNSAILIETSGSSQTVSASVASSAPFANVAIGDLIVVTPPGAAAPVYLAVDAKASNDQITVSDAVNLGTSGVEWQYRTLSCGYGLASGWLNVSSYTAGTVCVEKMQGTSTGAVTWWVETKTAAPGAGPVQADPDNSATPMAVNTLSGEGYFYSACRYIPAPLDWLRVGLTFAAGGDEGSDNTVALKERLTVSFTGRP